MYSVFELPMTTVSELRVSTMIADCIRNNVSAEA